MQSTTFLKFISTSQAEEKSHLRSCHLFTRREYTSNTQPIYINDKESGNDNKFAALIDTRIVLWLGQKICQIPTED